MTSKTIQSYQLPDDPDPQVYTCHKVYLPAGAGFERAFFGSITHLAKWVAWDRDSNQSGSLAASSMKVANDMTLAEWDAGGCVTILEPPYTEVLPDGRTPTEGTIDDWLWTIYDVIVEIDILIGEGKTDSEIINILVPVWTAKTGDGGVGVVTALVDNMTSITQAERDNLTDTSTWSGVRDGMVCQVDNTCPSLLTLSSAGEYYDWLNCSAQNIYDWLDTQSGALYDLLNTSAAILTGSQASQTIDSAGGGGSGFGFSTAVCYWSVSLDLTAGQQTFQVFTGPIGSYTASVGFEDACYDNKSWVVVVSDFTELTTITRVKPIWDATLGTITPSPPSTAGVNNQINLKNAVGDELVNYVTYCTGGTNAFMEWVGEQGGVDKIQINISAAGPSACDGTIVLHTIEIEGYGYNPFE